MASRESWVVFFFNIQACADVLYRSMQIEAMTCVPFYLPQISWRVAVQGTFIFFVFVVWLAVLRQIGRSTSSNTSLRQHFLFYFYNCTSSAWSSWLFSRLLTSSLSRKESSEKLEVGLKSEIAAEKKKRVIFRWPSASRTLLFFLYGLFVDVFVAELRIIRHLTPSW